MIQTYSIKFKITGDYPKP